MNTQPNQPLQIIVTEAAAEVLMLRSAVRQLFAAEETIHDLAAGVQEGDTYNPAAFDKADREYSEARALLLSLVGREE